MADMLCLRLGELDKSSQIDEAAPPFDAGQDDVQRTMERIGCWIGVGIGDAGPR